MKDIDQGNADDTYVVNEPKQGKYIVTALRHGGHHDLDTSDHSK